MTLATVIVLLVVSHPAEDEPKTAVDFYGRGLDWHQKKEYDKAIKDFSETIRLNPKQTLYYQFRSLC